METEWKTRTVKMERLKVVRCVFVINTAALKFKMPSTTSCSFRI